jgi:hypothetical protein
MNKWLNHNLVPAFCLLLTAATLAAFLPLTRCDFISLDDPSYVTGNPHVQHGLTLESIRWAFATGYASNWHPLTWASHMLDVQLFGLNPHLHHLTNLLFHIVNSLLLFLVFRRMTGEDWKSAFVAALFAVHPLHVESVAWVAERKDVLSTFFLIVTVGMYAFYAGRPSLIRYLAVILFFAFGLMSKPMLVTLPFVLLLLDYWPLKRMSDVGCRMSEIGGRRSGPGGRKSEGGNRNPPQKRRGHRENTNQPSERGPKTLHSFAFFRDLSMPCPRSVPVDNSLSFAASRLRVKYLVLEKLPLFVFSTLSCIVTYMVQRRGGAVTPIEALPLGARIANALVSYVVYIRKTFWPYDLAIFYPHPLHLPGWQVLGAALLLGTVTFAVLRLGKRYPFLPVGWLWYAGTLIPVLGVVQVGSQAMADRYTYVPLIGLFVLIAWGAPEFLTKLRFGKAALFAASAIILLCLSIAAYRQAGYWQGALSLWDHALEVSGDNDAILLARGAEYGHLGRFDLAIRDFDKALELNPANAEAYYSRAVSYGRLGNLTPAIEDYGRAVLANPRHARAYFNRGLVWADLGQGLRALEDMKTAARLDCEEAREILKKWGITW